MNWRQPGAEVAEGKKGKFGVGGTQGGFRASPRSICTGREAMEPGAGGRKGGDPRKGLGQEIVKSSGKRLLG